MNPVIDLPAWVALLVAFFVLTGAGLTLVGCIGLVRLESFYQRIHAPTLGTSSGIFLILLGSVVFFGVTHARPAMHEALIFIFITVTTPVTLMLLARAALYRDRAERNTNVPPPPGENPADRNG